MRALTTYLIAGVFLLSGITAASQANLLKRYADPPFIQADSDWVDETLAQMSLEERIGQLFMVAAYSAKGADHVAELEALITEQHIGGLIFFKGGPARQVHLTNHLQSISQVPLLIGMDAEWGLAMRLDSTIHYPYQMTLGAIRNDTIIYQMGKVIGRQLDRIGVHVNFAPVVDVNNNPDNPVINYRSFGEQPVNVARKGNAYMQGLQAVGVMANAKHFPGHGDTDTDSHHALPIVSHDRARLDSLELFPFRQLANRGLSSMMVAHLYMPQIDSTPHLATTLSPKVVDELLREDLGFKGLVFTDALNMKGVAKYWKPGEVDLKALVAGNDVLLFPEDVPRAVEMIQQAIADGVVDSAVIDQRCRRILQAKAWCGLNEWQEIESDDLYESLNSAADRRLNEILYERALTLVKNEKNILPVSPADRDSIAYLSIGAELNNAFHLKLKERGIQKAYSISHAPSADRRNRIIQGLYGVKKVIISIDGMGRSPKDNFGLSRSELRFIEQIAGQHETAVVLLGNPYSLADITSMQGIEAILVAYEGNPITRVKSAEAVLGRLDITGRLPVSIGDHFSAGTGLIYHSHRLKRALPEELGLNEGQFHAIDSIAMDGVEKGAYPGCVVMVAKNGKVIYERAFGSHTYENKRPTELDDIYDIASITKIASTGAALIRLVEEGKVDIDGTLGDHLPNIPDTSVYHDLYLREVLTHQAGLVPWIPFYTTTLKNGKVDPELYQQKRSRTYDIEVANNLYMHRGQSDTILTRILDTRLRKEKNYKYSDLGYYFMKAIIEEKADMSLDEYVQQEFYGPMDLNSMGYLPLKRFDKDHIVPTEYDLYYRMQLLQGHVHDMGAAMQGGVGGHAGLFSNAEDLAAMMQMFLNGGTYGGQRLLNDSLINEFTRCQYCTGDREENRRGIVFDKPNRHGDEGPTCDCVSFESFGHSGFTGTLSWADPEEDMVYIFLSNRVYPYMKNKKLITMNIRTKIMEVIYEAFAQQETSYLGEPMDLGMVEEQENELKKKPTLSEGRP
ncbi:MAG: serine hydrolase [Flavobacteriales bacterium]|nr:serine hydrolase [Flavobacteriales bacterium]